MLIDRLTERAKTVVLSFNAKDSEKSSKILVAIKKASGMGNFLYQNALGLALNKSMVIAIDTLVKEAYYQAVKMEHPYVGTEHLFLALLKLAKSTDYSRVKYELLKTNIFPTALKSVDKLKKIPILDTFGDNLNQKTVRNADKPLIYREAYQSLVAALLLKTTTNVLIIGDDGVGKRSLVDLLARNISSLEIPPVFVGYHVIEFDMMGFMTSLFNKGGNVDYGLQQLSEELKSLNRVILVIKNFQHIFFASSAGLSIPMFYTMFKSAIDYTNVRMIATMNSAIYDKLFSENEHLIADFSVIEVPEPTDKETQKIMESTAIYLSDFHNIDISADVIKTVYKHAKTIDSAPKFPQRGVELLDHCCTYAILKKSRVPIAYKKLVDQSYKKLGDLDATLESGRYDKALKLRTDLKQFDLALLHKEVSIFNPLKKLTLTQEDVAEAFISFKEDSKASVPQAKNSIVNLASLADKVKKQLIGQDNAVDLVTKSLIRSRLGLRAKKRPLGNFLFLGPTGVGKTELAKVLAASFFGDKALIRLDMSDFSEKHTAARLVGAPPGYVGFGEGGELTSKIEAHPDSVVLFDEVEKAHPDVLNILLQIMEEGELSDAKGNTFDFSKSVVILTSNLGTEILHNAGIGFDETKIADGKIEEMLKSNLKRTLKPELLNRFDELIVFHRLRKEDQFRILDLLIKEIVTTVREQKITLAVALGAKTWLLQKGYSEEYGARGLRRVIEKEMLDKIANFLLAHKKRPLKLHVELDGESLKIVEK